MQVYTELSIPNRIKLAQYSDRCIFLTNFPTG